jgi:hypothetical protein
VVDIAGVIVEVRDRQPEIGTDQRRAEFGDEFLGSVGIAAEGTVSLIAAHLRLTR